MLIGIKLDDVFFVTEVSKIPSTGEEKLLIMQHVTLEDVGKLKNFPHAYRFGKLVLSEQSVLYPVNGLILPTWNVTLVGTFSEALQRDRRERRMLQAPATTIFVFAVIMIFGTTQVHAI